MARLDDLYRELRAVESMTEAEVLEYYNSDSKQEIVDLINADISNEESAELIDCEDSGMDYDALCQVQGLSRY